MLIDSAAAWEACKVLMFLSGVLGFALGFLLRDRFWDIKQKDERPKASVHQFPKRGS